MNDQARILKRNTFIGCIIALGVAVFLAFLHYEIAGFYLGIVACIGAIANGIGLVLGGGVKHSARTMRITVSIIPLLLCCGWIVYASVNRNVDTEGLGRLLVLIPLGVSVYGLHTGLRAPKD